MMCIEVELQDFYNLCDIIIIPDYSGPEYSEVLLNWKKCKVAITECCFLSLKKLSLAEYDPWLARSTSDNRQEVHCCLNYTIT